MQCVVCEDIHGPCEFCPKVDPYELAISMGVEVVESGPLEPFSARAAALALSESFPEIETERIQYGIAGRVG